MKEKTKVLLQSIGITAFFTLVIIAILVLTLNPFQVQTAPAVVQNHWQLDVPGSLVFNGYGSYKVKCSDCYLVAQTTNTCWDVVSNTAVEPTVILISEEGVLQGTVTQYDAAYGIINEVVVFRGTEQPYNARDETSFAGATTIEECESQGTLTLVSSSGQAEVSFTPE
ncbi:hypothetical protein KBC79_03880 [Candidatus Woesebacteria bacterium]|nr:hypothetical protein [Candidatus Woesebacteria bacterium]